DQALAQVAAERRHALVGVEQDQRALFVEHAGQGVLEVAGDGRQFAALDQARLPAAALPKAGDLTQQGRLADAADAVDEHHRGRRVVDEQTAEVGEFRLAPDEPLFVTASKALSEGGWQGWTPDSARLYLPWMTGDVGTYYAAAKIFRRLRA